MALFSYRYDAHLVPGLIENIRPFVHGYVAFDDRKASGVFSSEPERRNILLKGAYELGATWVLTIDPDERVEDRFVEVIDEMTKTDGVTAWAFRFREMFSTTAWRSDGVWGNKVVSRLFRLTPNSVADDSAFHGKWIASDNEAKTKRSDITFYHFRCAHPKRRKLRRDLYASEDPKRKFQKIGYDYLDDERGMVLENIAPENMYSPRFKEDGGLWAAKSVIGKQTQPDPIRCKLNFASASLRLNNKAGAFFALDDVQRRNLSDVDMRSVVMQLSPNVKEFESSVRKNSVELCDLVTRLDKFATEGQSDVSSSLQKQVDVIAKDSVVSKFSQHNLLFKDGQDFKAPDAIWRRWAKGDATISEGFNIPVSELAVVIIAFRAQATVFEAVKSILSQNEKSEIVVVNSGGGNISELLRNFRERLRIIDCKVPLQVGAARNIGVDASRAKYISFLAGDCVARPDWVKLRLKFHRDGHVSVSTPVETSGRSVVARAANILRFWTRQTTTEEKDVSHFGRSFSRIAFHRAGYFPSELKVGEDTYHNNILDSFSDPYYARDIITLHKDPESLLSYCVDEFKRGRRRASHAPYRPMIPLDGLNRRISGIQKTRLEKIEHLNLRNADSAQLKAVQRAGLFAEKCGLLLELKKLKLSFLMAKRAIALNPTRPKTAFWLARSALWLDRQNAERHYQFGVIKRNAKGYAAAIPHFEFALALAPNHFLALGALAIALEAEGKIDDALKAVELACTVSPKVTGYLDMACELAFRANKHDVALIYGRKALAREPNNPLFHCRLANIHIVTQNETRARQRLRMARDLEMENS